MHQRLCPGQDDPHLTRGRSNYREAGENEPVFSDDYHWRAHEEEIEERGRVSSQESSRTPNLSRRILRRSPRAHPLDDSPRSSRAFRDDNEHRSTTVLPQCGDMVLEEAEDCSPVILSQSRRASRVSCDDNEHRSTTDLSQWCDMGLEQAGDCSPAISQSRRTISVTTIAFVNNATTESIYVMGASETILHLKERIKIKEAYDRVDRLLLTLHGVQLKDKQKLNSICKQHSVSKLLLHLTDYSELATTGVCHIEQPDRRGISFEQISQMLFFVDANCSGWASTHGEALSCDTMDMYQCWKWVIQPTCKPDGCSYVELAAIDPEAQIPRWFVAHAWQNSLKTLISCIGGHVETRDLPSSSAYWLCGFASRYTDLEQNKSGALGYMPLFRAMRHCEGLLLVLDAAGQFFRRIWCCFECMVLTDEASGDQLLCDIATTQDGVSRLLTGGLTMREREDELTAGLAVGWRGKRQRESAFPLDVVLNALVLLRIAEAKASNDNDRKWLLHDLSQSDEGGTDTEKLDSRLHAMFAVFCWPQAVESGLDAAGRACLVTALKGDGSRTSLRMSFNGVSRFGNDRLVELGSAMPEGLLDLHLELMSCPRIDDDGIASFAEMFPVGLESLNLNCMENPHLTDQGVGGIAAGFTEHMESVTLAFSGCDGITDYSLRHIAAVLPENLVHLDLTFEHCEGISDSGVHAFVKSLPCSLISIRLNLQGSAVTPAFQKALRTIDGIREMQMKFQESEVQEDCKPADSVPHVTSHRRGLEAPGEKEYQDDASVASPMNEADVLEVDHDIGCFFVWAADRWKMIHELFKYYDTCADHSTLSGRMIHFRTVSAREFVEYVWWHGFEGNALKIFHEIGKETPGSGMNPVDVQGFFGEISLQQVTQFERRYEDLKRGFDSPAVRFTRKLRKERGCLLRAWRLDLDQRSTGLVAFADFISACRRLGFASEAKELWNSFRQSSCGATMGGAPLEFREFDAHEASNLDNFTEVLWNAVDFDLNKAWSCIDPNNRGFIGLDEFTQGVHMLGFEGNARLLFKGLDSMGFGKLRRNELDYLNVLALNASRTQYCAPPIRTLCKWAQTELGGPKTLLDRLGLNHPSASLTVDDLAHQLMLLGFRGDARRTAALTSRIGGGGRINGHLLYSVLADVGGHTSSPATLSRQTQGVPKPVAKKKPSGYDRSDREEWKDGVQNSSLSNVYQPASLRSYFSAPDGGSLALRRAEKKNTMAPNIKVSSPSSKRDNVAPKPSFTPSSRFQQRDDDLRSEVSSLPASDTGRGKAEWNNGLYDASRINRSKPVGQRTYFPEGK